MARGINKVILLGHLGRDPEVKYMANGNAVTNIAIATSEAWKDQNGNQQQKTEWHRVVIFGKLAEIAGKYLKKGSLVYIEGQLQTRKWTDQSGQDRYTTEVVVNFNGTMQMLDRKPDHETQQDVQQPKPTSSNNAYAAAKNGDPVPTKNTEFDQFDDDIPF